MTYVHEWFRLFLFPNATLQSSPDCCNDYALPYMLQFQTQWIPLAGWKNPTTGWKWQTDECVCVSLPLSVSAFESASSCGRYGATKKVCLLRMSARSWRHDIMLIARAHVQPSPAQKPGWVNRSLSAVFCRWRMFTPTKAEGTCVCVQSSGVWVTRKDGD